ncbi:MAG: thiamine phosphate synthase [Pseudomonadota bacterium]|nr:thiamine phosphate synthase [Pseudomonadota bacterium]
MASTCRLYLITPPKIELPTYSNLLKQALDGGDVACLQIRLKQVEDDEIRKITECLQTILQSYDVAVIMNDRPDLAAELGCDGVHVGQEDTPYKEARSIVGEEKIVGVTCKKSRHLAIEAADDGADYVAFGGFFHSSTKQSAETERADPEILSWWTQTTNVPCVAIGGITVDNCKVLVESGADMVCVVSGVWDYAGGPAAAVNDFNRIFVS